jgi:hypothetical protein
VEEVDRDDLHDGCYVSTDEYHTKGQLYRSGHSFQSFACVKYKRLEYSRILAAASAIFHP